MVCHMTLEITASCPFLWGRNDLHSCSSSQEVGCCRELVLQPEPCPFGLWMCPPQQVRHKYRQVQAPGCPYATLDSDTGPSGGTGQPSQLQGRAVQLLFMLWSSGPGRPHWPARSFRGSDALESLMPPAPTPDWPPTLSCSRHHRGPRPCTASG